MKTLMVSFSGGRTSAFMARLIAVSPIYKNYQKVYLFANTGREREETLQFVEDCSKHFDLPIIWVEAVISQENGVGPKYKVVSFETAARREDERTPFDDLVDKLDIPNPVKKGHCTRDLKLVPMQKYMKDHYGNDYLEAVGIRADEKNRCNNKVYPLCDFGIDEQIVREFWERQPFDLNLKDYQGNCDFCFKKSLRKRLTLIQEDPEGFEKWARDEKRSKGRFVYDRDGFDCPTLKKMAAEFNNPVKDKMESGKFMPRFEFCNALDIKAGVSLDDLDLDKEQHCFCSLT